MNLYKKLEYNREFRCDNCRLTSKILSHARASRHQISRSFEVCSGRQMAEGLNELMERVLRVDVRREGWENRRLKPVWPDDHDCGMVLH